MEGITTIAELDRRFGMPGIATVVEGHGGLPKVRITSPQATGEMYLHGGHVTSWRPAGADEVLFVSSQSRWQDGRAIRGGVPVCFPWFGNKADDGKAPAHGFVRTKAWQLETISRIGDAVIVSMFTENDENTKKWWPADFRLVHRAAFGSELRLELTLTNTGTASLRFEEALHAYQKVGHIEKVRVGGLCGVHYVDKTDRNQEKTQQGEIVITSETDRVYLNTSSTVELEDPVLHRRTQVSKENSRTTVVWNPFAEKSRALNDLGADQWKDFICIETSNVGSYAVEVSPGHQHTLVSLYKLYPGAKGSD